MKSRSPKLEHSAREAKNARGYPVVPAKHPWRWVGALIALTLAALLLQSLLANPNMQWDVVLEYLFNTAILSGLSITLQLTVICMVLAIILGTILALMRLSENPVLRLLSALYIWFFRGTPLLVQLIFWYNLALLFPVIGLQLPEIGVDWSISTNQLITGFTAAMLGLTLHEAAYMTEIIRGGIIGVEKGQTEAAASLGLTSGKVTRFVILPQTIRLVLPPTGNQLINMLKMTSIVAFIGGGDLLTQATNIYASTFQVIPLLLVASLWYLVATSVASVGQHYVEERFGRGYA